MAGDCLLTLLPYSMFPTTVSLFMVLFMVARVEAQVTVNTEFGKIQGHPAQMFTSTCEEFLGIPYAEPPVRFQSPVAWTRPYDGGVLVADTAGSQCLQADPQLDGDENCLFINVWRPPGVSATSIFPPSAAMLYIHGGINIFGNGVNMNGCLLAASRGVIVGGMNYRLGVLGFGAFPSASSSSQGRSVLDANWGYQDQRLAMRWFQTQLTAFGGDPQRVTIFGESSGAMAIYFHMAAPLSRGLFQAAIIQSGFPTELSGQTALNNTADLASRVGCLLPDYVQMRACLMLAPAVLLMVTSGLLSTDPFAQPGWLAVIDGIELSKRSIDVFRAGEQAPIPLMTGYTTTEAAIFIWQFYPESMSAEEQREETALNLKHVHVNLSIDYCLETYNSLYPTDRRLAQAAIINEGTFIGASVWMGAKHAEVAPVWAFRFDQRPWCLTDDVPGAWHGVDKGFPFGLPEKCPNFTASERLLSEEVQALFSEFAKSFSPQGALGGLPLNSLSTLTTWDQYTNESRKQLVLREPGLHMEDLKVVNPGLLERCEIAWSNMVPFEDDQMLPSSMLQQSTSRLGAAPSHAVPPHHDRTLLRGGRRGVAIGPGGFGK